MKKIITAISILITTLFSGCKKELLDINTNPNAPSNVDASLVLPAALANTAARINNPLGGNAAHNFSFLWMGYGSYSGNFAIATTSLNYNFTNTFEGGMWALAYKNIADYNYIETKSTASGNNFIAGISKIMKSLEYQNLVDVFNNIPYFDAARGADGSDHLTPKYDDAKLIYEDLIKQIDAGITAIKGALPLEKPDAATDIMFAGDKTKWVQFANTLKLRILIRQSEMTGRDSYIAPEISKIVSEGSGFLNIDATINPGYSNSAGKMNPSWGANYDVNGLYSNSLFVANQYAINFYTANNDPRLGRFYEKNPAGIYQGNYFGDPGSLPNSSISFFGRGVLKSATQSSIIISGWESAFLQAEAIVRGWLVGDAKTMYETGVKRSFIYLEVPNTASAASSYYSQANNKEVNFDATTTITEKIALIIRQKWAANNLINVLEAWNDYRRLKLPSDIPLSRFPSASTTIPLRLLYPQGEYSYNPENVSAQGTINQFSSKIFWMK